MHQLLPWRHTLSLMAGVRGEVFALAALFREPGRDGVQLVITAYQADLLGT